MVALHGENALDYLELWRGNMRRTAAGIGYGFLFGAGIGLTIGVLVHNIFLWTITGIIVGVVIGLLAAKLIDR
jgi:hypothetical protein